MFNRFIIYIKSKEFLDTKKELLLAVSGGIDSMVMLHLFQRTDFQISIAHVDHLTRDGESTKDAEFVEKYCQDQGLKFYLSRFKFDKSKDKNFHNAAREHRYEFFRSLNYDLILTAHHQDDNVETVLFNLLTGRSVNSIPERNDDVFRPLLNYSKKAIREYAEKNGIPYREDISNSTNDYDRNFIRNSLLPLISTRFDNFEKRLLELSSKIQNERQSLISLAKGQTEVTKDGNRSLINKKDIIKNPELLQFVLSDFGFNSDQAQNMVDGIDNTGASFSSSSHQAVVDRDSFIIEENTLPQIEILKINPEDFPCEVQFGNTRLKFSVSTDMPAPHKDKAYFPKRLLNSILFLTTWREGDHFQPYGMDGKSQSLKKFFTEKKIDRLQKSRIPILRHNDDIIWVCGYRTDERYKYTDQDALFVCAEIID